MQPYALLKLLHIAAVVIFLGNIITGLFWMKQADKTGDTSLIAFTIKSIIKSDKYFTIPGVLVILAGGFGAAIHAKMAILGTGWILWPIILFSISGIIFGAKLGPLQSKIHRLAAGSVFDQVAYKAALKQWEFWGFIATLAPVIAMAMMVLKIPR